jgi:hypothetical protein
MRAADEKFRVEKLMEDGLISDDEIERLQPRLDKAVASTSRK